MKLSFKIFAISFLIVISLLGLFGFVIITNSFNKELIIEKERITNDNKFLSMVITSLYKNDFTSVNNNDGTIYPNINDYFLSIFQNMSNDGEVFIGTKKRLKYVDDKLLDSISSNEQIYRVIEINNTYYSQVITKLSNDSQDTFIEHLSSLQTIYDMRSDNYHFYTLFLIIGSLISSIILYAFSIYVTYPLKKLNKISKLWEEGNFNVRNNASIRSMKSVELSNLALQFNNMADKLSHHIEELEDYNQRQEDFISRFTHELKTPLTSIIGYADVIRTYDVDSKKRHEFADYIFKEGKRLEELTQHLLKLILLKNDEFDFIDYNSKKLFRELDRSTVFLVNKYEANISYDCEEAIINIEPVLLKSLLYNLVDNACKASIDNKDIIIRGKIKNDSYVISVIDHGKGIDEENLSKVTEPFFMEDKSRSRKQGGAGLGLSLAKEIARIHGSELDIKSKLGKGTTMSIRVRIYNEK